MINIKDRAIAINPDIINLRRHFHMFPEISGSEEKTAERVSQELRAMGYDVLEKVGGHGVVAQLNKGKDGKIIALRADMDALEIKEQVNVDYCSKNDGVMHACGHDAHVAMLLGAAKILAENKDKLNGSVRLIFQPSEELTPHGGSKQMINEGALEGVDAVFGLHIWPDLPLGTIGLKSGALMAASDHFTVQLTGKSSHAAQPNDGIDAIVMGTQYVQAIQSIISRETNPMESAVITVGKFYGGTRYNIVAESCTIEGTCRTLNEDIRDHIEDKLGKIVDAVCLMHGAKGSLNYERGYMAVINDEAMIKEVRTTALKLFGQDFIQDVALPSMCAEDFSFYLKDTPGAFIWLGTGKKDETTYPLHNSKFNLDEDVLWRGTALMAQIAIDMLI